MSVYTYYMFHLSGSSTACILSFNCNTGLLHTANLGDSGFLAIRNGAIIGESMETVHYFNCPFQLSNPPPGSISHVISDRYSVCWFSASLAFRPHPPLVVTFWKCGRACLHDKVCHFGRKWVKWKSLYVLSVSNMSSNMSNMSYKSGSLLCLENKRKNLFTFPKQHWEVESGLGIWVWLGVYTTTLFARNSS